MRINDLLEREGLTGAQLSSMLGYKGAEAVNKRRRENPDAEVPETWYPKLAELGFQIDGHAPGGPAAAVPPTVGDTESQFREDERPPAPPGPDVPRVQPPVQIDYATVAGYIEGTYKLAAQMGVRPADPLLADVIDEHAEQAGKAWAHWIESEPKVAALIQRMMIGTPLGEVIGVHVAIVFSYTIARSTARSYAERERQAAAAAAEFDGSADDTSQDHLA